MTLGDGLITIGLCMISFGIGIKVAESKVDLPEEISQISNDSNKPDTLLGYKIKDKYYIRFTGKHR